MRSDGRGISSNLKRFKMLRNASKISAMLDSSTHAFLASALFPAKTLMFERKALTERMVEHHERLAHSGHNCIRKCTSALQIGELFSEHGWPPNNPRIVHLTGKRPRTLVQAGACWTFGLSGGNAAVVGAAKRPTI